MVLVIVLVTLLFDSCTLTPFLSFLFSRVWFYTFVTIVATMCAMTVYFCVYLLRMNGWDWLVVIGLVEAIFFSGVGFVVWGCTVRNIQREMLKK